MKGCRPLEMQEVRSVVLSFEGKYRLRNRALFLMGVRTGYRVSEMLSLTLGDVWRHGRVVDSVSVARRNMKGSKQGREVELSSLVRQALTEWIVAEPGGLFSFGYVLPEDFLFQSGAEGNRAISRVTAYRILKQSYDVCRLNGKLATHTMRKTFARDTYEDLKRRAAAGEPVDPLFDCGACLGHLDIKNTVSYLSFRTEVARKTQENIENQYAGVL